MSSFILEQIVNGIITGSMYALVAAGMTMIFGVLRAINFAHGEYYMLGTFAAWWVMTQLAADYSIAIIGGVAIVSLIAVLIGRAVMQRLIGQPFQAGVLATLNSDDPGMMRFDIADEYVAVAGAFGYSLEDMEAISLAGVDACWAPDDEKQALRDRFAGDFDQLRHEFGLPRQSTGTT